MRQEVDEESPGWRLLLPTDAQLLAEAKRSTRSAKLGGPLAAPEPAVAAGAAREPSAAELCTLDMLAVLSQLRYLSALLHLLWRLVTAVGPAGAQARRAVAGCPRLLAALCEIAVHRWAVAGGLYSLQTPTIFLPKPSAKTAPSQHTRAHTHTHHCHRHPPAGGRSTRRAGMPTATARAAPTPTPPTSASSLTT